MSSSIDLLLDVSSLEDFLKLFIAAPKSAPTFLSFFVPNNTTTMIKISNIDLPEGVKPTISDRDFVIATLAPPTVEVETKSAESEEAATEEGKDDKSEESLKTNPKKAPKQDKIKD